MPPAGRSSSSSMRTRISLAALLVKVTARMPCGETPSIWMSQAIRWTSTRVLPLPAPARTSRLPGSDVTALRWLSLRGLRMWDISMAGNFTPSADKYFLKRRGFVIPGVCNTRVSCYYRCEWRVATVFCPGIGMPGILERVRYVRES